MSEKRKEKPFDNLLSMLGPISHREVGLVDRVRNRKQCLKPEVANLWSGTQVPNG